MRNEQGAMKSSRGGAKARRTQRGGKVGCGLFASSDLTTFFLLCDLCASVRDSLGKSSRGGAELAEGAEGKKGGKREK